MYKAELMPVVDVQKMDEADKRLVIDAMDRLGKIAANDVGYDFNFSDFYYKGTFNSESYDDEYKVLAETCNKYIDLEHQWKPMILMVWW